MLPITLRSSAPLCSKCLHSFPRPTRISLSTLQWLKQSDPPHSIAKFRTSASTSLDRRKQSTTAHIPLPLGKSKQLDGLAFAPASSLKPKPPSPDEIIPPDASSQLTTFSSSLPKKSLAGIAAAYLSLTKPRLTFLMVLTTTAAYSIYPITTVAPSSSFAVSTITLLFLTTGTALTSSSANAFNMYLEPEHDRKMSRTRNRPLVRGLISLRAALVFAVLTGCFGTAALYYGVNPTTAALAAGNVVLYAGLYTPLKRIHPINTWVGAVVGAIPPLMGWTAAAAATDTTGDWRGLLLGPENAGGWALAALLFFWQIPHFAGLSFSIRHEYAAAGYRMLASSRPRLDALLSLGCAVVMLPAATAELVYARVVEPWMAWAAAPANAWMSWQSWQFLRLGGAQASSRKLFWASVWYLPIMLVLCMVGKKGVMDGLWRWVVGKSADADTVDQVLENKNPDATMNHHDQKKP